MKRALVLLVTGLGVFLSLAAAPPAAVDDQFVYSGNQAAGGWFTVDVLANDTLRGDQVRTVELVSGPTDGVVEPTTRPVGFRWRKGSSLTARWSYRIVDTAGARSNTAVVSVGVRLGPLPRDDSYQATSGVLLTVSAPGVLAGDTHPAGERLTAEVQAGRGFTARGGRVVLRPDGSFDYAPPLDFTGTDSFGYRAVDPQAAAADATVTIVVRPRETVPTHTHPPSPTGDQSSGKPEVTVHLHGYPAACRTGPILIGGRRLDTWLDEARQGRGGAAAWEFIDLHAFIPDGLAAGKRTVEFRCAGTTYPAGTMMLPTGPGLTTFELTWKSTTPPTGGQATETPGPPEPPPEPQEPQEPRGPGIFDIPILSEIRTDLRSLAESLATSAAIIALVLLLEAAFPADLVNKIIEFLRTPNIRERLETATPRTPGWVRTLGYAALGGTLLVWADAEIKAATWDWGAVLLKAAVGAVSLVLVVSAYEKPKDTLLNAGRGRGHLRAIWLGFLVAATLATLSRFLGSPVPYVYGLVVTFIAVGAASKQAQGRATLGGGIAVLVTCVGLWVAFAPLVVAGRDAGPKSPAYESAFAICVVLAAGIQVVVFGLLPIKPLDGYALKDWSKVAWWALYAPTVFFYVHVVLRSVHPAVDQDPSDERIFVASCLFVLAGGASFLLRRIKAVSDSS
ncbi:hypothetical protein BS329_36640 [Amycolatopsis coloradensis]|uniref:Uncharacterized protein n=1 Tax=Amycolatopsis coloradensis TaxID=76021 RepID=A0A1R0KFV0_9PSEU|nr:FGLLP motif-containing membrane protein [Amycolatopsis coloradensis]OLZ44374.1 hypothetical protein BS329_36640 [Amycolatopsis coloradensis]